jgi:hypothetical protein
MTDKKGKMTRVGFEPTHISVVEIGHNREMQSKTSDWLKSTALDHSAIVSESFTIKRICGVNVLYPNW